VRLLQELSTSIYTFIAWGKYPLWYKESQKLIEYGIARFMGDRNSVIIEEPMALVGMLRYFEAEGLTIDADIRVHMQSAKGLAFQEAVLLSCTRLFRKGARLSDIFLFEGGKVPDWAHQKAYIVSQNGQELGVSDIASGHPILPSAGVAHYAENPNDVRDWIISKRSTWCIPGRYMGPDLLTWLRLEDGKLLLLLIQAKCCLTGNISTLAVGDTADAVRSLITNKMFSTSVCYSSSVLSQFTDLFPELQICKGGNIEYARGNQYA
jgi:hypothetical protein